jgi:hypothetical protein
MSADHDAAIGAWLTVSGTDRRTAQIFAVGVSGFSVMDNHLHVLLRLELDVAQVWSGEEGVTDD